MKDNRQFILDTLLPYKEDPKTCGYDFEDNVCTYLTSDGRMCAVGQHLDKNGKHYDDLKNSTLITVTKIFKDFGFKETLTKEAYEQNLHYLIWAKIQIIHDVYAKLGAGVDKIKDSTMRFTINDVNERVEFIERELNINLDELKLK